MAISTSRASLALALAVATLAVSETRCAAFTQPSPTVVVTTPLSKPRDNGGTIIPPYPPTVCSLIDRRICSSVRYNASRRDTSLSMGFRSFIKRRILRRGEGDEDEEEDGGDDDDVSLNSILQSPGSAGLMESPFDSDIEEGSESDGVKSSKAAKAGKAEKANPTQYVDDFFSKEREMEKAAYEDTQERIRRMKGGGMTEEEKMAFLNNALAGPPPKQKPSGPPIRQKVPGMEGGDDDKSGGGLWNAITKKDGRKDKEKGSSSAPADISVASLMMDGKMKNEEAKRKYMESITNPDRFATFSTYQQPVPTATSEVEEAEDEIDDEYDYDDAEEEVEEEVAENEEAPSSDGADFAQMKRQIVEDRELLNPSEKKEQNTARDAVESILSMISNNNDKKAESVKSKDEDHLAARLGQAAEEQEKRDKEARKAADRKKEEEKIKWAEMQKKREEEAHRKEVERMEKAKKIADKERRREEEKAAAERAELEARQAQQDDYWAKMLEKENERKARMEPVDITRKKEVISRDSVERMERDVAKDVTRGRIREEERAREDPHEGEILKEAAEANLRNRERVRDIEEASAARVSKTVPKPSKADVSASSFVREQQRKKEEMDRLRQMDQRSLKSLNSPLPSPGRAPIGIPPSPPPRPVPARSSPDLSLASLTMAKQKEGRGAPASPPPPAPPASSQRLNLNDLTRLKKDSDSNAASPARRPPPKKKPPKRTVRQQLPLSTRAILDEYDDDDDEDDENLMRSGAPGLTVADALKQQRKKGGGGSSSGGKKDMSADDKAKQWGIDMSKF